MNKFEVSRSNFGGELYTYRILLLGIFKTNMLSYNILKVVVSEHYSLYLKYFNTFFLSFL